MPTIENQEFGGERPLFGLCHTTLKNVTVHAGESALKHVCDVRAQNCRFEGKYPFWHADHFEIDHCTFTPGARAALWYSSHLLMTDTTVDAPKMFRNMQDIRLRRVTLTDAAETFWDCRDIHLNDVSISKGDYLFSHSENIRIENYRHQGNYAFQNCRNITISEAVMDAKDLFWNSENICLMNCRLDGEFMGWHSKNLTLINCRISGTQPFCYCENLVLENCTMAPDCDLAFEYSCVTADIKGTITSIRNPTTGRICSDAVKDIILDDNIRQPADCRIETDSSKN